MITCSLFSTDIAKSGSMKLHSSLRPLIERAKSIFKDGAKSVFRYLKQSAISFSKKVSKSYIKNYIEEKVSTEAEELWMGILRWIASRDPVSNSRISIVITLQLVEYKATGVAIV